MSSRYIGTEETFSTGKVLARFDPFDERVGWDESACSINFTGRVLRIRRSIVSFKFVSQISECKHVFFFLFYTHILLLFSIFAYVWDGNVFQAFHKYKWIAKPSESVSQKRSTYIKYREVKKSFDKINIPWWPWLKEHKGMRFTVGMW